LSVRDAGRVVQLSVSAGGVPKQAVPEAQVSRLGLDGDLHRDLEHHGGPERAVCLFSLEVIRALSGEGHGIAPGALGENVTISGLDWALVVPQTYLLLGDRVLVQVTRYASPCATIAATFVGRQFGRVSQKHHPGWSRVYARVLVEGHVRADDPARIMSVLEVAALGAVDPP
jgi:MOSC domain-containing protein YiiM